MNNKEKQANWYDDAYTTHLKKKGQYSVPPEKSVYYKMWLKVIEWISDKERIIDLGCGVGQFAELCFRFNKNYVYGCDFSTVAIKEALKRNAAYSGIFYVKDLRDKSFLPDCDYDVIVLLEVMEHIDFDREVLEKIPTGKRIILSLPNYMCSSHIRCFADGPAIHERYKDYLTIKRIGKAKVNNLGKCIWVCDCIKK